MRTQCEMDDAVTSAFALVTTEDSLDTTLSACNASATGASPARCDSSNAGLD
jgi:hypothetical protein